MYCVYFGEPAHPHASESIRKHPKSCARTHAPRAAQRSVPAVWLLTSAREIHERPDGKEGDPGSVCKEDWPHKWAEYTPQLL
jgi:hypothetical protein